MPRVLITGAAGFLGSHVAEAFVGLGWSVVGVDNLLGGDQDNVPDGVEFHHRDCTDLVSVMSVFEGVDLVYHCAAAPHEGLSVFSPCVITHHTYISTVVVATAAIRAGVRRIVFTSSMARYGHQEPLPFVETMTPRPVDPYGVAKVASEQVLDCLNRAHGIEYVIAVPHNIIGPRQKYDDPFRNVASIMINRMLQGKQPIIYGDGLQTRSFSFVADCVSPLVVMGLQHGLTRQVINIGPDEEVTTLRGLAEQIAAILGFPLDPIYLPARPMEVKHAVVSADKARRLLGYETTRTLEQGLREMIATMVVRGPKPFIYHLPIEIDSPAVPETWRNQIF